MTRRGLAVCSLLSVLIVGTPAAGQDISSPRPFRGVFGGAAAEPGLTHSLDLTLSASGAYDHNDHDGDEVPLSQFERTGAYELASGELSYTWLGTRVQMGATAGGNVRYSNATQELLRLNQYGAIGVAGRVANRLQMYANQSVNCGPLHFQGLSLTAAPAPLPGAISGIGVDFAVGDVQACAFDSAGAIGVGLAGSTDIEFLSSIRYTNFEAESGFAPFHSYSAGGRLLHNITRNTRLRLEYMRRSAQLGLLPDGAPTIIHDVNLGADYARPLSLTRRTFVDFRLGSTVVTVPEIELRNVRHEYALVGDAGLNHEMGRTWRTRLAYSRAVTFVEGFIAPAFANVVNTTLTGFITRRLDLAANAAVSVGAVNMHGPEGSFRSHTGFARLRFALARAWALQSEYTYYAHELPANGALLFDASRSLRRHAVRVGLSWWLPLTRG